MIEGGSPDRSGSAGRILRGAFGVGAVRVLIVLSPLILLPILLSYWGVELYGAWITANAIAGFLSAVSLSILPLMAAETALCFGAGDRAAAAKEFKTLALSSGLLSLGLSAAASLAYWLLTEFRTYDLAPLDLATVLLLLLATALAGLASIYSYALGAIGDFGLGNGMEAARRGAELAFTVVAVMLFDAPPLAVALFMILTALFALAWTRRLFSRRVPWRPVDAVFDPAIVRRTSASMFGSVLLAGAYNQVAVLAPRVLIEHLLGAREVVQFATISNLTRGVRQFADILVFPFQPEFSFAAGSERLDKARSLYLLSCRLAAWLPAAATVVLLLAGPALIRMITGGGLVVDPHLFAILALAAAVECALLPATIWLIATGRVLALALGFLFTGGPLIAAAAWAAPTYGTIAFAYATLATALLAGIWATHLSLAMLRLGWRELLLALRRPPVEHLMGLLGRLARRLRAR